MKRINAVICIFIILTAALNSCTKKPDIAVSVIENTNEDLTILEFGSTCVPCAKMKIVLDILSEDYGESINIKYIDTGTDEGEVLAADEKIMIIPSQIFLDSNGEEFFRHSGYMPQEEILTIIKTMGIDK